MNLVPRKFDLKTEPSTVHLHFPEWKFICFFCCNKLVWSDNEHSSADAYLSFPIYPLLDLDISSAANDITYSVEVVLLVLFAERRNFPFSTSKAAWLLQWFSVQFTILRASSSNKIYIFFFL